MQIIDRPEVGETNGLVDGRAYHDATQGKWDRGPVCWTTKGLKITRLRLLSDPGYPEWDVSYCDGVLDGKDVRVQLPFSQLSKRKSITSQIVNFAKEDGLFAKGTGILGAISCLN